MTNTAYPDSSLFANPWPAATGWNSSMTAAVGDYVQAYAEACTGWQQEIARFSDARLQENRRTWQALLASRDLAGVLKVQQEWGLRAATDYAREATRLAQLTTSLSLTGTTPAVQELAKLIA